MRVGTGLHVDQDVRGSWSEKFSLEPGSTYRQLKIRSSRNSFEWNYSICIDIRTGNGYLRKTNFIFLNSRYILCNQSSYNLLIVQRNIANDDSNCLQLAKHANVAYHWPRTDIEQLLCVRILNDDHQYRFVHWSGGFSIDATDVFHINMRYENGECFILQVQVVERNDTYFVIFMDSTKIPPPFRICNRSDVPIEFYQTEISEDRGYLRTIISPCQSLDYALDEPKLKSTITCSIVNGSKAIYDLLKLGHADNLYYPNYIYLILQATFDNENTTEVLCTKNKINSVSSSPFPQLVIEYSDGRILATEYQEQKRSQLWLMTNDGHLIHVESSSIQNMNIKTEYCYDIRQAFVLDIQDSVNQPFKNINVCYTPLTVRRYDPKRTFTQRWQFLDNGYLCMANTRLCVQVFGELIKNNDVVLGPIM